MTDHETPARAAGPNWWRILHIVCSAVGVVFLLLGAALKRKGARR